MKAPVPEAAAIQENGPLVRFVESSVVNVMELGVAGNTFRKGAPEPTLVFPDGGLKPCQAMYVSVVPGEVQLPFTSSVIEFPVWNSMSMVPVHAVSANGDVAALSVRMRNWKLFSSSFAEIQAVLSFTHCVPFHCAFSVNSSVRAVA